MKDKFWSKGATQLIGATSIKTTRIDVDKIDNIFDEILTFILDTDTRDTQDDCMNRVKVAELILKLANETMYRMMDITCNYRHESTLDEFAEQIIMYRDAMNKIEEVKKYVDILQG